MAAAPGADFGKAAADLGRMAAAFATMTTTASLFGAALSSFREFERQMVLVNSTADGTAKTLNELSQAARNFSLVTTTSAMEAGVALLNLAQAGFTVRESLSAMNGVLLLAQATLTDVGTTADVLSANIRAFGLETFEATRIANVFAAAAATTLASMDKLAYAMRQVAPVAELANLSIEETTAALGILFNVGLRGEQAGTALRNIIIRLVRPLGESGELLRKAGIATRTTTGEFRNLHDILTDVANSDLSNSDLAKIFETEALAGVRAMVNAIKDIDEAGDDGWTRIENGISNTDKALELAAENLNTFDGAMKLMQNSLLDLSKSLGEEFNDEVRAASVYIREVIANFQALDPEVKAARLAMVGYGAAAVAAMAALAAMFSLLRSAGVFWVVTAAVGALATALGVSVAAALGFVAVVALVAAALARVVIMVNKGIEAITGFNVIGSIFDGISGAIRETLEWFGILDEKLRTITDVEAFKSGQASAQEIADAILGENTVEEIERRVTRIQNMISMLSETDLASAGAANRIQNTARAEQSIVGQQVQALRDQSPLFAEYVRLQREIQEKYADVINDPNANLEDIADAKREQQRDLTRLLGRYSDEDIGFLNEMAAENNRLTGLTREFAESAEDAKKAETEILVGFLQRLSAGEQDLGNAYSQAEAAITGSSALNTQAKIEAIAELIANQTEYDPDNLKEVLRDVLTEIGVAAEDVETLINQADIEANAAFVNGMKDLQDSFKDDIREIEIDRLERGLDQATTIAEAVRAGNELGVLALEQLLDEQAEELLSQYEELLIDLGADGSTELLNIIRDTLKTSGIEIPEGTSLSDALSGRAMVDAINDQIDSSTTIEEAHAIIEAEQEKFRQVMETYITEVAKALNLSQEQVQGLRDLAATSSALVGETVLDGIEEGIADRDKRIAEIEEEMRKAAEELRRAQEKAAREREQAARDELRRAKDAADYAENLLEEARNFEDAMRDVADARLSAQRRLLESSRVDPALRDETFQMFDVEEIRRTMERDIRELERELEDLTINFTGNEQELGVLRNQYTQLIEDTRAAAQAEIAATDSFTAQMDRRSQALDLFQRDLENVAFESEGIWTKIGAGIASAFTDYQRDLVTILDITKDATLGFLDTLTTGISELVFYQEDAESLRKEKETAEQRERDARRKELEARRLGLTQQEESARRERQRARKDVEELESGAGRWKRAWEAAMETIKKGMLDLSQQIVEGFSKAFIQQAISSMTGSGGSILGNILQPSGMGNTGVPGVGAGGLLGRLFPGLAGAGEDNAIVSPMQQAIQSIATQTEQVYDQGLVQTRNVLSEFARNLDLAFDQLVASVGGNNALAASAGLTVPSEIAATGFGISALTGQTQATAESLVSGLIGRGLTPAVARGAVANFMRESGLNAGINEINPTGNDGRGGHGLYQLTDERRTGFEQYASAIGVGFDNIDAQLDYFVHELNTTETATRDALAGITDSATAADIIARQFLRPADATADYEGRMADARALDAANVGFGLTPDAVRSLQNASTQMVDAGTIFADASSVFSPQSMARLEGVDPGLVAILTDARRNSGVPFEIGEGLRSIEEQAQHVASGASQTMNSNHIPGRAADIYIPNGQGGVNWDFEAYRPIADAAKASAAARGIDSFEWGGDWESLRDGVHFEVDEATTALTGSMTDAASQIDQAAQSLPGTLGGMQTTTRTGVVGPGQPGYAGTPPFNPLPTGGVAGAPPAIPGIGTPGENPFAILGTQFQSQISTFMTTFQTTLTNFNTQFATALQQSIAAIQAAAAQASGTTIPGLPGLAAAVPGLGTNAPIVPGVDVANVLGDTMMWIKGGYTGDRDIDEIAGFVHGKEFVMNARATKRYRPLFEMLNKPGYRDGGYVGPENLSMRRTSFGNSTTIDKSSNDNISLRVSYVMNGSGDQRHFRRSSSQHAKQLLRQLEKARRNT